MTLPAGENTANFSAVFANHTATRKTRTHEPNTYLLDSAATSEIELTHLRRFSEVILRYLPIGVVVIDNSYRILIINGNARRILGIRDLGSEQDFLHAVRGLPYTES